MEDKIKELEKELKYLTNDAIKEEVAMNKNRLKKENVRVIANDIYLNRGLDVTKLKRNITSNLINDFGTAFSGFKECINLNKIIICDLFVIFSLITCIYSCMIFDNFLD